MEKEFWRWKEYRWHDESMEWRRAKIISAGIDIGSVSSQAVVLADGQLFAFGSMRTGASSPRSARKVVDWTLEPTGMSLDNIIYTVGTGYGKVNVPFASKTLTEIACHARGGFFFGGKTVRTILDVGGQDCKAIRCDGNGGVVDFIMNDRCAAGTGRGMEIFADLLNISVEDIGRLSFEIDEEPEPVSSACVIFAKSEAMSLLREGWPKNKVLAAYCGAMASRIVSLMNRIGVSKDLIVTGGISKNIGVVSRVEKLIGIKSLKTSYDTQIAGAFGAALFAFDIASK